MKPAFILSLLLLGGPATAPAEAVGGLEMTIRLDGQTGAKPGVPIFRIDFHNAGSSDLVLNVGVMLANGKRQYPNAVVLNLTDPQGKFRQLNLTQPAFVAGRVDPMVLPLPVGSTFSIPVDLKDYRAAASGEFELELKPGTFIVSAQLTGKRVDVPDLALMPYWTGTVISNSLRFEIAVRAARAVVGAPAPLRTSRAT